MSILDASSGDQQIAAILVVGFHHAFGPIVEFCIPSLPNTLTPKPQQKRLEKLELPEEWNFLPFLALPDGAHQKDEDFAYFHLPPVPGWAVAETTLFGISCNRQIASKDLLVKTADITRSIVQKAVVVLAKQPIFGPLAQKLAVITAAWFNQRDFTKLDILYNLYSNLDNSFYGPIDDSTLYMGTSLRELVFKFKSKTLMLLKLLLLEKKILFYGYPVERLCTFQYSLISLIPGLLRTLQDSGSPELDTFSIQKQETLIKENPYDGTKKSLFLHVGLPLRLFQKKSFFQPYLPLQQIDMLSSDQTKSYLAGTTNQIFFHHKSDTKIDVLVNVESGALEFYDTSLVNIVSPTMADSRWMDTIVKVVNNTWNENDPSRPLQNTFLGSDDYLRVRFEEYVLSLLSSVKHGQKLESPIIDTADQSIPEQEPDYLPDYGTKWLAAWQETTHFETWNKITTSHKVCALIEPGHPGMGNLSVADLSSRLRDLPLTQNLGPLRDTLSKAFSGGAKVVSNGHFWFLKGVDSLWNDIDDAGSTEKRVSNDSALEITTSVTETTNHSGSSKLFSNFSSFLGRKSKEFTPCVEVFVHKDPETPNNISANLNSVNTQPIKLGEE